VLITPAGVAVRMTITARDPNTIMATVQGQPAVHRHIAPAPSQHQDTIPTLYTLSRQPGTAAWFVSETVMVLVDSNLEGFGYRWHFTAPERSHWGYVGRRSP
jgi:hypothetical protein